MEEAVKGASYSEAFRLPWRKRIFVILWITYSAYYLCRLSISIAIPGIVEELGLTYAQVGLITSALFASYAAGQFINGQLGDRIGARKLMTFGMLGSAICNLIFSQLNALPMMILIWFANGYFQSTGWPLSCKTLNNWFPRKVRGRVTGIYGMCYQVGNVYTWILTGWVVATMGWRYAFIVNSILFAAWCVLFFAPFIRDKPEDVGLPPVEVEEKESSTSKSAVTHGFRYTLRRILDWKLLLLGIAFIMSDVTRYGLSTFIPAYLVAGGAAIEKAAIKIAILPTFGALGSLITGWMTDKFFGGKRAPVVALWSFIIAGATLAFLYIPVTEVLIPALLLAIIGFTMYGAHMMMVGTLPMDIVEREAVSSAVGFIDCLGYVGAFAQGIISGILIDLYGFAAAFYFWAGAALIQGILLMFLSAKAHV